MTQSQNAEKEPTGPGPGEGGPGGRKNTLCSSLGWGQAMSVEEIERS